MSGRSFGTSLPLRWLDTIHLNIEERSILETIRVHGQRIRHFHLCESNGGPFGTGNLDFPSVLQTHAEVGYAHFASVKIYRKTDWEEAAAGQWSFCIRNAAGRAPLTVSSSLGEGERRMFFGSNLAFPVAARTSASIAAFALTQEEPASRASLSPTSAADFTPPVDEAGFFSDSSGIGSCPASPTGQDCTESRTPSYIEDGNMRTIVAAWLFLASTSWSFAQEKDKPLAKTQKVELAADLVAQVPADWKLQKSERPFRTHDFILPSTKKGSADGILFVMHMGKGSGGGLEDNLKRWYGMVEQPDGGSTEKVAKKLEIKRPDAKITWLDLLGTYLDKPFPQSPETTKRPHYRVFAAMIDGGKEGPYWVRAYGPEEVMKANRDGFEQFLNSITKK